MNILLVNDDGIECEGILSLVRALSGKHTLTVVSPESERSGFSHSLSIHQTITVKKKKIEGYESVDAYAISGTPADCTKLGVLSLCREKPELVISGINNGENVGTDVAYSGTCSAAMEGVFLGIRSIAVSQRYSKQVEFESAAKFVAGLIERIADFEFPAKIMLNINFPDLWVLPLQGIRITELAKLKYDEGYNLVDQQDENTCVYKLFGTLRENYSPNSDDTALSNGYISITPIGFEATAREAMRELAFLEKMNIFA